jgi:restriction system protein
VLFEAQHRFSEERVLSPFIVTHIKGNTMAEKELSRSRKLAAKTLYAALVVLKDHQGELPGRTVMSKVEKRIGDQLDEWATERYEASGNIRWQAILHFFTIDAIKAGYMVKKKGVWYLTPEGEAALELGDEGLLRAASRAYRQWKKDKQDAAEEEHESELEPEDPSQQSMTLDQMEQIAVEQTKEHLRLKNPYEFQDLCAALLRGMGYHTPFVAPRGKDGGIDVIAYRDPLGTTSPRIKVQVKHREASAPVQDVRQLMGLLQKDGDVGMFVATGGFTPDAKAAAIGSHVHVELVDLLRFIDLWQQFYHSMSDEDKDLLPLKPVYFVAPSA